MSVKCRTRKGKDVANSSNGQPTTFTTKQLLKVSGLTRRQLECLEQNGAVRPVRKGYGYTGMGSASSLWTAVQIFACAVVKSDGGGGAWSREAAAWLAKQSHEELLKAFSEGRTTLALSVPPGQGFLVDFPKAYLKEGVSLAPDEQKSLDRYDLSKIHERVEKELLEMMSKTSCPRCEETEHPAGAKFCADCGCKLLLTAPATM